MSLISVSCLQRRTGRTAPHSAKHQDYADNTPEDRQMSRPTHQRSGTLRWQSFNTFTRPLCQVFIPEGTGGIGIILRQKDRSGRNIQQHGLQQQNRTGDLNELRWCEQIPNSKSIKLETNSSVPRVKLREPFWNFLTCSSTLSKTFPLTTKPLHNLPGTHPNPPWNLIAFCCFFQRNWLEPQ